MNNEYVKFAINEINKALDDEADTIYVGKDEGGNYLCPIESWNEFLTILKNFAIEEECYEEVQEIIKLQSKVQHYVNEKSQL